MNITAHLARAAREHPDAAALIAGRGRAERRVTFRELDALATRSAEALGRAGLKPGDRMLLLIRPSADLFILLLGALRLGVVCILPDAGGGFGALRRVCGRLQPQAAAAEGAAWPLFLLLPELARVPLRLSPGGALFGSIPLDTLSGGGAVSPVITEVPDGHPALITSTSGTTGRPKIAVRAHGFLEAQRRAVQECLGLRPGETELVSLPVFTLANLAAGVTSVIADASFARLGRADPARVFAQMARHRPDRMACSPAFIERLLDWLDARGPGGADSAEMFTPRRIFIGGAPVFPALLRRIERISPDVRVTIVYGSTEAEPVACLPAAEYTEADREAAANGRGLLVGKPVPGIEARVLRDRWGHALGILTPSELARLTLPPGQAGEIAVSGPNVLGGYLDGEGDSENKFRADGRWWHRTGDAGRFDGQGRLWLLGRCARRIGAGQGPVYNLQIEAAAMSFDWVRQAGVVLSGGRRFLAIATRRAPHSAEFRAFRLALGWADLSGILTFPSLPVDRRHNAKIDHAALERAVRRALRLPKSAGPA